MNEEKSIVSNIFFVLSTISLVLFASQLFVNELLPPKYRFILIIFLVLIHLILGFLVIKYSQKKVLRIILSIILGLLILIQSVGAFYIYRTYSKFNSKIAENETKKVTYSIITLKNNYNVDTVVDMKAATIYYDKHDVKEDIELLKSETDKINEKLKYELKHWGEINDYLKSKNTPIIVVGIPDQSHIFADKYPTWAYNQSNHYQEMRKYFFNGLKDLDIDYLDFDPIARENREHYYYKADHHPNFNASLKIYDELINRISENYFPIKNLNNGDIELVENPNRFIGSHNRKVFEVINENTHAIYAQPKKDIPFKRYDSGKLSDLGIINPNSKFYTTYMYGDNPYTVIDTNRKELPNIMIIGDSTTNALESIMWMNANKFTSLDFRHYKEKNIIEFLEENPQDLIIVSMISGYYEDLLKIMK